MFLQWIVKQKDQQAGHRKLKLRCFECRTCAEVTPLIALFVFLSCIYVGVSKNSGFSPQNGWFKMEKPYKNWMIWGVLPLFLETSMSQKTCLTWIPRCSTEYGPCSNRVRYVPLLQW